MRQLRQEKLLPKYLSRLPKYGMHQLDYRFRQSIFVERKLHDKYAHQLFQMGLPRLQPQTHLLDYRQEINTVVGLTK